MIRYQARDLRCPRCGAPPGEACLRIGIRDGQIHRNGRRRRSHLVRVRQAATETARRTPRPEP